MDMRRWTLKPSSASRKPEDLAVWLVNERKVPKKVADAVSLPLFVWEYTREDGYGSSLAGYLLKFDMCCFLPLWCFSASDLVRQILDPLD